jgi:ubiquinone/menaquinone biosynthesis C-methylase UbiE
MGNPPSQGDRVRAAYDAVADSYDARFSDELDYKPLDRALLHALCELSIGGTLADVGCGPGQVSRLLAERHADVVGLDVSAAMIALARHRNPRLTFTVASMLDLPFPDHAFSGVVSLYSIIHFTNAERTTAFSEFSRTLAPGGWLLVAFHVDGPGLAAGDVNHVREFLGHPVEMDGYFLSPESVIADLDTAGFNIHARVEREAIPDVEYPSRRCYLLAQSGS